MGNEKDGQVLEIDLGVFVVDRLVLCQTLFLGSERDGNGVVELGGCDAGWIWVCWGIDY